MSTSIGSDYLQIPTGPAARRPAPATGGMLFFNRDKNDLEKYVPNVGWVNLTLKSYRYWRYVEGAAIIGHHPRVSRIMLKSEGGQLTTIVTYAADNYADSGAISIGTVMYDFGAANPQRIIGAQIFSTYGGGARASNYTVQYSNDNSNWYDYFSGVTHNVTGYGTANQTPGFGLYDSIGGFTA